VLGIKSLLRSAIAIQRAGFVCLFVCLFVFVFSRRRFALLCLLINCNTSINEISQSFIFDLYCATVIYSLALFVVVMTTAHRPTFHPAVGSANAGGFRYHAPRVQKSVHDLPQETTLKFR
jgi:Cwf15/Cwc15 cell cycle control protein